jgi:hypothetical protein
MSEQEELRQEERPETENEGDSSGPPTDAEWGETEPSPHQGEEGQDSS